MTKGQDVSKSDDLEIVSIGALYNGPWDKKYWSSSRGKDRYPYPVGFQALRTHNGFTYKLEIYEGAKGPIFQVTSSDGQYCSGQTPDIAWENFQKRVSCRIKLWHGKRYSCKIDGMEFFGFRNVLVQRLLREMVSNVNGASDGSSVYTNSSHEASANNRDKLFPESSHYPDLIPYLEKCQTTGKRSRKYEGANMKPTCGTTPRRSCPQLQADVACSNTKSKKQKSNSDKNLMISCTSLGESSICEVARTLPVSMKFEPGKDVPLLVNGLPCKSDQVCDDSKETCYVAQEKGAVDSSGRCMSATPICTSFHNEEIPLGRLQIIEGKGLESNIAIERLKEVPAIVESIVVNHSISDGSHVNNFVHLCAPDTLDSIQEACNAKVESAAADMPLPDGSINKSHQEEESATCNSNDSPEKDDLDSVGEDIAQAMMTVLLPRALPLLTYASRKKKRRVNAVNDSPSEIEPENEYSGTRTPQDVASAGQTEMHSNQRLGSAASGLEKSIIPDSFENDQCDEPTVNKVPLSSDIAEVVESNLVRGKISPGSKGLPFGADDIYKRTSHHNETNDGRGMSHLEELQDASREGPLDNNILVLDSALVCRSPGQKIQNTRSKNNYSNSDDSPGPLDSQFEQEENGAGHDCAQGRIQSSSASVQISEKEGLSEVGNNGVDGRTLFTPSPAVSSYIRKYVAPLSESIICRNLIDDNPPGIYHGSGSFCAPAPCQISSCDHNHNNRALASSQPRVGEQLDGIRNEKALETLTCSSAPIVPENQGFGSIIGKNASESFDSDVLQLEWSQTCVGRDVTENKNLEVQPSPQVRPDAKVKLNDNLEGISKLIGCYSHPMRISSVTLTRKLHEIYVCVSCGLLEEKERNLFVYQISINEPTQGCPSFVGHTSVALPVLKDTVGREIQVEKSGLAFTPNAQGLVLLDSIKAPHCREQKYDCLCSSCASYCIEESAVKIVQVNFGYISLVVKLKTLHPALCLLVCEPNHLVAVDKSGRLYIWVMNPTWSAQTAEFIIPGYDFVASRIVELKRIPNSGALVLGHNGFGDFSLWDIMKRTIVSRFSAPVSSILQFLPVSLLSWKDKGLVLGKLDEECVSELMAVTMRWMSEHNEKDLFSPREGEDIAIWILICTASGSLAQPVGKSSNRQMHPAGCWRLGLLIKDIVILGTALDPRTTAIGTSAGHGIIGTHEGLTYMWELSTGTIAGPLHNFEGSGVSDIAADNSKPAAVAIAGEEGQLWIYLHPLSVEAFYEHVKG